MDEKPTHTTATIYIRPELKAQAQAVAGKRRRSLSEYIVALIERDLRKANGAIVSAPQQTQEPI